MNDERSFHAVKLFFIANRWYVRAKKMCRSDFDYTVDCEKHGSWFSCFIVGVQWFHHRRRWTFNSKEADLALARILRCSATDNGRAIVTNSDKDQSRH